MENDSLLGWFLFALNRLKSVYMRRAKGKFMKRIKSVLFIWLFFIAYSMATFADARTVKIISSHGEWRLKSDCTSVYAVNGSASAPEGFKPALVLSCDNGYHGIPNIRLYWSGKLKLPEKSQFQFELADNDLSDGWICESYFCTPEDDGSAAKILDHLLANEGPFAIVITDENKTIVQAAINTTGINEAYQALLKHRR